ncbi:MAG: acetolactate decarboxylase, partial [Lentisphaerota bacterium]
AMVPDQVHSPFACVTFFSPDTSETLEGRFDYPQFIDLLNRCIPSNNLFYALRIDGHFEHIRTRSVPRQANYTPLVDATKGQTVLDLNDVEGTLVGFYSPSFVSSIHVPGYHLHFLTEDRTQGGHLLECCMTRGKIGVQNVTRMELHLPVTFDFLTYESKRDTGDDLKKAER